MAFLEVLGFVCLAAGLIANIYIRKNADKCFGRFIDNILPGHEDDEEIPEAEAKAFMKKSVRRFGMLYWIPHGLEILGGILLVITNW